jgi:hypothetical protein
MMNNNRWFRPNIKFSYPGLCYLLEFKPGTQYQIYKEYPNGSIQVQNGMNYVTLNRAVVDKHGIVVTDVNPYEEDQKWLKLVDKLLSKGYTEEDLKVLAPYPELFKY